MEVDRSIQPRPAPVETAALRCYTVAPDIDTPIALTTLPHAVCCVHAEGDRDPRHWLKAWADGEGTVRFHVRPGVRNIARSTGNIATHDIARLEVDCTAKGNVVRYPLHLRVGVEPTVDMPSPPVEKALALRHGVKMRRALSRDEAMGLADEEALAQGLPLRPNPESVPQAFDAWLRCLSMPACRIEPQLVSNPDVTHGKRKDASASSSNWCGYELLRAEKPAPIFRASAPLTEPFDWVSGTWHVPFVSGEPNTATYSALWVGLDGSGTADLVQAGTAHEALQIDAGGIELTLTGYHAWAEFLPQQGSEQVIGNFAIHPGDEIFTAVWFGNGDNAPSLASASATFFMMNLTTGAFTSLSVPRAPTCVKGREAVWAMERPTVGGRLPDLANYGSAVMYNASARRANSPRSQGFVPYRGARNLQSTMVNGPDTLSTVTAIDSNSMRFEWKAFN